MGTQTVSQFSDRKQKQAFIRSLLNDIRSFEYMLEHDWFESGITRFGSELEMVLIDKTTLKPKNIAMPVIDKMKSPKWLETELAQFNLELNLTPREMVGNNFSLMEAEIQDRLKKLDRVLNKFDATYILTGILPTIQKFHLNHENITPRERYYALLDAIKQLNLGKDFELKIFGIDELFVKHNSPLLEAANTSWQVHLQCEASEYVKMYNIAQTLAGPTMAIAANSPLVFGKRLWHESRIAMFEQALDTRRTNEHMREQATRVSFGRDWLDNSILEIYKEDISRFKVLLSTEVEEDSWEMIKKNKVPELTSLLVHNGTVYRWNRPQFGISKNGQPHLRIENRVLPAGPTVPDQMANAVFWLGAMKGMAKNYPDIQKKIDFSALKDNFGKGARFGLQADFTWINNKRIHVTDLIKKELIPLSREGLKSCKIDSKDINKYLGIIKERVTKKTNGAIWMLDSYEHLLKNKVSKDETLSVLTHSIMKNQQTNKPVHTWKKADLVDMAEYKPLELKVSEFMQTDLFTVANDDIIEMVAELMDWRKIRFVPVEDEKGNLKGIITSRLLTRNLIKALRDKNEDPITVEDIMIKKPRVTTPDTSIMDAMKIMRKNKIGCLPVVENKVLVGVITETDFLDITSRLLERLHLKQKKKKGK
ncbi:MAG: CBS domain-containing protein [Saprospiraceae bacterium]|nr:CBS domain-containing protein [Bacteroidia bacterium]NNE14506.1 CBS domain-containing protein [Saprospiraceae bacterium]NNL92470.1 CBS domain-containing protein [Saprospiraceae bacterium]